jgi:hypothetical protein
VDLPAETLHYEPGLHLCIDPRPLVRAKELADQLDARLCTTAKEADALLDDLSTVPTLGAEALATLGALADRVQTARRIEARTVDRAAEEVGERLAATGTGVAVHPTAVRDRAARVLAAREQVREAEERLRIGEAEAERARAEAAAEPPGAPVLSTSVAATADEPPARRRWFRRRRKVDVEDTTESTSLLQQVAATTDEVFGARRAAAARNDQLLLLRAQRDRAVEEVRVAERAWRDLAGDDPVEDVEAVVRRFDPQHQDALEVAQDTIGVRAVSALVSRALAQWIEGWQSFGFDEPPLDPEAMGLVVVRGTGPVVVTGGAVDRAQEIAASAPAAPVLAVDAEERSPTG